MTGSSEIKALVTLVGNYFHLYLNEELKQYFNFQKNAGCSKKRIVGRKKKFYLYKLFIEINCAQLKSTSI